MDLFGLILKMLCGGYIFLISLAAPQNQLFNRDIADIDTLDTCLDEDLTITEKFYDLVDERKVENEKAYKVVKNMSQRSSQNSTHLLIAYLVEAPGVNKLTNDFTVCRKQNGANPSKLSLRDVKIMMKNIARKDEKLLKFCKMKNRKRNTLLQVTSYTCPRIGNTDFLEKAEMQAFKWKPVDHKNIDLIKNAGIIVDMDRSLSSIQKRIENTASTSICDDFENGDLENESKAGDKLVFPFSERKYPEINLKKIKSIMNSSPEPGYLILEEALQVCSSYKNIFQDIFANKYSDHKIDLEQAFDLLLVEKTAIIDKISSMKKSLEKESIKVNIKDITHLMENVIIAELKTMKLIMCTLADNSLKAILTEYIFKVHTKEEVEDFFSIPSMNTFDVLDALISSLQKKALDYMDIFKRISETAISFSQKKKVLAFLPKTYYPSNAMAKYLITGSDLRICKIENIQKQIDRRLLNLKNQIRKIRIQSSKLSSNSRINPGEAAKEKEKKKKVYLGFFRAEQKIYFHLLKNVLSVFQMISEEVDVIKDEMTSQQEYKSCQKVSTETHEHFFIQKDIAVDMLESISNRAFLMYEMIDAAQKQKYMLYNVDVKSSLSTLSSFDLLDPDKISQMFYGNMEYAKKLISFYLPIDFPNTTSAIGCSNYYPPIRKKSVQLKYKELVEKLNEAADIIYKNDYSIRK